MKAFAARMSQLDGPVDVFFRDDDAGWADHELFALVDIFARYEVPLDLAVIPAVLERGTAATLLAAREEYVGLGLHQHGYAHINYEPEGARKCEFGLARPVERQIADVIAGRERLAAMLGDAIDPIFTPPWNRCLGAMLPSLPRLGFALLSTDRVRQDVPPALGQLPVSLDWERARREGRLEQALIEVFEANDGPVGVMLHHATMDEAARAELSTALSVMSECPAIRPHPMRRWIAKELP